MEESEEADDEVKNIVCRECGWMGGRSKLVRKGRLLECPDCGCQIF